MSGGSGMIGTERPWKYGRHWSWWDWETQDEDWENQAEDWENQAEDWEQPPEEEPVEAPPAEVPEDQQPVLSIPEEEMKDMDADSFRQWFIVSCLVDEFFFKSLLDLVWVIHM